MKEGIVIIQGTPQMNLSSLKSTFGAALFKQYGQALPKSAATDFDDSSMGKGARMCKAEHGSGWTLISSRDIKECAKCHNGKSLQDIEVILQDKTRVFLLRVGFKITPTGSVGDSKGVNKYPKTNQANLFEDRVEGTKWQKGREFVKGLLPLPTYGSGVATSSSATPKDNKRKRLTLKVRIRVRVKVSHLSLTLYRSGGVKCSFECRDHNASTKLPWPVRNSL
ncbi:hypothetical protein K491DRAFT_746686 [Lophiostoma macrostomum CBS 122681]|uniref:Uncharacterized protein n=1 Tax=Lophiostoma macrostomum CBS 122681 TaxID=1314788 RepID=A0A6A6TRE3_9PLEO|nr:hypothetical protein K491DRAFT_746686 [Lophiostoma macrostomum CBS 122681]